MLRITTDQRRGRITLGVEGRLAGPWVRTLEDCWRDLRATAPRSKLQIDLCGVSYIDNAGKLLLSEIHREGGRLIAEGCLNQAIIEEIVEAAEAGKQAHRREARRKSGPIIFWLFLASLLAPALGLRAQEKPAEVTTGAPAKLTLDRAVSLALRQNPQVRIAVLQAAQSEQDRSIARAALLPQADLHVSDAVRRQNIETGIGFRIPGAPQHTGPFQVFSAGPALSMPVFDLTLWRRWQASRENVVASRVESQTTREQVVLLVVSQYLGCVLAGQATPMNPAYRPMIDATTAHFVAQGSDPAFASTQAHGLLYSIVQRQSAMLAFIDNFWMLGVVFLAVIPLMFLMKRAQPPRPGEVAVH